MANIKIASVHFTDLIPIKSLGSRSRGQVTAKDAAQAELTMTEVDGLVLIIEGQAGRERIPMSRVKVALEAPAEEPKSKKPNG